MPDAMLIKDWYDRLHASRGEKTWRPREAYPIILDYLSVVKGRKLLDVGCGTGYLLSEAEKRELETWGIDISDEAVKIARRVSPGSKISSGSGESMTFPEEFFDYVTCLGALEHFLNIKQGIREMVRVSKDNALFCFLVPNANFLFWKNNPIKGTAQRDIKEALYTLDQWKGILNENGLAILRVYHDRWIMKQIKVFIVANPIRIMKNIIMKLLWLVLPLKYTYQFVLICRKSHSVRY